MLERIATGTDGTALPFRVVGAPNGDARAPMLTVHGLVSTTHHWKFFTPHYAAERPVISWDYRGHGGNALPDPTATVEQFADDAYAVWRGAGAVPAVVTGLSFGVQVALELWRRHRDAVRALVIICGTAGHPLIDSALLRRGVTTALRSLGKRRTLGNSVLALLRTPAGTRVAREIAFLTGGAHREACPHDVLDGLFAHAGGMTPELVANVTAAYLEHDAFDVLPTVDVPALVIAGDRDRLTPVALAERMAEALPRGELVVFPGHTHLVQVEKPNEVHATIDAFLARHGL